MKSISLLVLLSVIMLSCKNTSEDKTDTAANDTEIETSAELSLPEAYKLSLAQWSFHLPIQKGKMDPLDFAEESRKLGFDAVQYVDQLYTIDPAMAYKDAVMALAMQWKEKNEKFNIFPDLIMIDTGGELSVASEKERKIAVEKHKAWVDAAAAIGAPAVRVNLFGLTEPKAWHQASVTSLTELGTYAATKNIQVLPENHAQLSNNPELMVAVIKAVNLPNVGLLPDFGNFCIKREGGGRWNGTCIDEYDSYKGIEMMLPYAGGVSAKSQTFDADGNEEDIDYYRMFQILKDANFNGYIGVEYENEEFIDPTDGINATRDLIIKASNAAK